MNRNLWICRRNPKQTTKKMTSTKRTMTTKRINRHIICWAVSLRRLLPSFMSKLVTVNSSTTKQSEQYQARRRMTTKCQSFPSSPSQSLVRVNVVTQRCAFSFSCRVRVCVSGQCSDRQMNVFIVIFRLLFEENKERVEILNLDSKTRTSADASHHGIEDKNE